MTGQPPDPRAALQRLVRWYETLSPQTLAQLPQLYRADARFKDPFNQVQGLPAIAAVFEHMFRTLREPRFVVRQQLLDGALATLVWDFQLRRDDGRLLSIHGASVLQFDAEGLVAVHRDYWDAAEELYARLPLLGVLMRWLQRRLAAPQPGA